MIHANKAVASLHRLLDEARTIVALTGAGISTESGVPDFRSPGSPWMENKPIPFDVFLESTRARDEAWRRKFTMDDMYRGAAPNAGHAALAAFVHDGRMPGIVTQNIDGLHQASGVPHEQVIELHGNGTYARCLDCGTRQELEDVRRAFNATGHAPPCSVCGGILKSATISFGQAMPMDAMARACDLASHCDLFLAIGTSLVVKPAATLPLLARRSGAVLVILNREPTPLDGEADLVVREEIGSALSAKPL
jgi:NAD-dependent deacetylase